MFIIKKTWSHDINWTKIADKLRQSSISHRRRLQKHTIDIQKNGAHTFATHGSPSNFLLKRQTRNCFLAQ